MNLFCYILSRAAVRKLWASWNRDSPNKSMQPPGVRKKIKGCLKRLIKALMLMNWLSGISVPAELLQHGWCDWGESLNARK